MEHAKHDLHWLAQQYVLDELDADEAAAFENRLHDDEQAAAAVAAAVRTVAAVNAGSSALARMPSVVPIIRRHARGWLAASVAAVAFGLALILVAAKATRHAIDVPRTAAQLVGRWNDCAMHSALGGGLATRLELPAQERLPRWLVAAVTISGETIATEESN